MRKTVLTMVAAILAACGGDAVNPDDKAGDSTPATITLQGASVLNVEDTLQLSAVVRDHSNNAIDGLPISWTSSDASVLSINSAGLAIGHSRGTATIEATVSGLSDSLRVSVTALVESLSFSQGTVALTEGDTLNLSITVVGNDGLPIDDRAPDLSVSDVRVADVSSGRLAAVLAGTAELTASIDGIADVLVIAVASRAGPWTSLSVGQSHSCAVDSLGVAACWGSNNSGALGLGDDTDRNSPGLVTLPPLKKIIASFSSSCALDESDQWWCWGNNRYGVLGDTTVDSCGAGSPCNLNPTQLSTTVPFVELAIGNGHVCGLDPTGIAYCGGANRAGQLGIGTDTISSGYAQVNTTESFTHLVAGQSFTCGLTGVGEAYCWGSNEQFQIGADPADVPDTCTPAQGPQHSCARSPVKVQTPSSYTSISAGEFHSCAITATGAMECWGLNSRGQLGTGDTVEHTLPVAVSHTDLFSTVSGGRFATCALNLESFALCWGRELRGELGNGTSSGCESGNCSISTVLGGITFADVGIGDATTCGLSTTGGIYCWGANGPGSLGNGTNDDWDRPVRVLEPN